jgi:hypothetical protein
LGKTLFGMSATAGGVMVLMMKKRMTLVVFSFLAIMILMQGTPVNANAPSAIDLSYDFGDQVLTVDITHPVSNVNTHYILTVTVDKNSVEVLSKTYSSQNTTSGFLATYSISAVDGDVLSVTAVCVQSGQISDDITVVEPATTTTDTTSETTTDTTTPTTPTNGNGFPITMPLMIAVVVVVLGVVMVIVVLVKRR